MASPGSCCCAQEKAYTVQCIIQKQCREEEKNRNLCAISLPSHVMILVGQEPAPPISSRISHLLHPRHHRYHYRRAGASSSHPSPHSHSLRLSRPSPLPPSTPLLLHLRLPALPPIRPLRLPLRPHRLHDLRAAFLDGGRCLGQ